MNIKLNGPHLSFVRVSGGDLGGGQGACPPPDFSIYSGWVGGSLWSSIGFSQSFHSHMDSGPVGDNENQSDFSS